MGRQVVSHFDNATPHSRRNEHWVCRIELSKGRVVKRRSQQRVGGWGASQCMNWLKVSTHLDTEEVAEDSRARKLIALERYPDIGM